MKVIMFSNIYVISNNRNEKVYVGQSINPVERFNQHKRDSKSKKYKNIYLYNTILKYGIDNFKFEVIESSIPLSKIDDRERFWIKKLSSKKPFGYNLTDGGEGTWGYKHTQETKAKISAMKKGKFTHYQSDETKEKIAESNRTRIVSKETKQKISNSHKGKLFSDEHRKKLSFATLGKKKTESHKENLKRYWSSLNEKESENRMRALRQSRRIEIAMYSIETGEQISVFESMRMAAKWTRENTKYNKASHTRISFVCGKEHMRAYGFKWGYK